MFINNPNNMEQENVLDWLQEQIKQEVGLGLEFIQPKREIFRDRLVKYIDQDKEVWKIWVNTIYAMVNLWIAIKLKDKASVVFRPRQFWDEEYADNLTALAEFDYTEMELEKKDYWRHFDTSVFWYAIKSKLGRNDVKWCPDVWLEDPLTWIPDPYGDYLNPFRFHYFEKEILKSDMTKARWFDESKVSELTWQVNEEIQTNKSYRNEVAGLNNIVQDNSSNFYISVYDWYTYYKWELYKVTTASETWEVIRAVKIKPVRLEEKKNGFIDIRTQVNIEWFSPIRWNPCWISMVDLIVDKQTALSELLNLRLIDAKFSTFGQTNIYNTDIIKNAWDLTKPSINTKWIWVSGWNQNLSNAVYPVPRQNILADSYNVSNELARQIPLDTWISENQLGVPEKNITLWQSQQVQANANLKLALWITISNWWEKDFWDYIWLRSYEEYFGPKDTKMLRISNGFWVNVIEIRKDDFLWWKNPDITIDSKVNVEAENQRLKADFLAMLPYWTNDPSKPKVLKNIALRYALKLQWVTREMINILTYEPSEEKAKMLVKLLNEDDLQGAVIDDMSEDHLTYMIIFESALDTKAKRIAIDNRKQAYIMSGQVNAQFWQADWWMVNQSQAQLTSNSISQWAKQPTSLQNIWQ